MSNEFDPFYISPKVLASKKYKDEEKQWREYNKKAKELLAEYNKKTKLLQKEFDPFYISPKILEKLNKKKLPKKSAKRKAEIDAMMKRSAALDAQDLHISKQAEVELMKSIPTNRAFLGAFQSFKIIPLTRQLYAFDVFFRDSIPEIRATIAHKLTALKGLKVKLSYKAFFVPGTAKEEDYEKVKEDKNLRTDIIEVFDSEKVQDVAYELVSLLIKKIEAFENNASGWKFYENIRLDINIYKYNAIRGSSYIRLPSIIANKKACINIENNDEKCFLYSVCQHVQPQQKNPQRQSKHLKTVERFKDWKHEYPMKFQDIPKFEKQFNLSINVYVADIVYNKTTKEESVSYYTRYVTPNIVQKVDDVISLLLITEGDKSHYVLIKSMSALMYQNYNGKGKGAVHLCPCCLRPYRTKLQVSAHLKNGCAKFGVTTELPCTEKAEEYVQFRSTAKMCKKPFVMYADFESILESFDDKRNLKSKKYQSHTPCGYAYKRVSTVPKYDKDIVTYRGKNNKDNVAKNFIDALVKEADEVIKIMSKTVDMDLTLEQEKQFQCSDECYLCGGEYDSSDKALTKVRDHDHLTGDYRGAAHNKCNLQYGFKNYKMPVIFHNLKGYDSHFIVRALNKKIKKIRCIASSSEKFITFSVNNLEFIDSMSFISTSLEKLTESLSGSGLLHALQSKTGFEKLSKAQIETLTEIGLYPKFSFNEIIAVLENKCLENINAKFSYFQSHFSELTYNQKLLLTQKGVYPYDYMNSFGKFRDNKFPTIDECFSKLNDEPMDEADYKRALDVWESFNIKNMGGYHDLYLKTDVLLLADVFENFRTHCLTSYKLDPTHYYTLPGFAWDAMLKMTGVKLDVFSEELSDMYLMVERGIRGGISVISNRHSQANNKYIPESYNPNLQSTFITYLDANNLYGWAMIQSLATGNYKWCKPESFNSEKIMNMTDDQSTGYIFDVDLEYPEELHDYHNDYPLAPEKMTVQYDQLSEHTKRILSIVGGKHHPTEKLIPNLNDKLNYVVHYRNLKLYLELGLKIKAINKVMSFSQSKWLKKYIDFNTNKRKEAKEDFEKDLYKLMNNAVFGKTMENVRKRVRYDLVNNDKTFQKMINDVTFKDHDDINEDLKGVSRSQKRVKLDKPICVGFGILELSKVLMYDFHYNIMKKKYGDRIKLLFTDTDSLCYEIQTDDLYKDFEEEKDLYDFSELPKDHILFDSKNKKVIGKFKPEEGSKPIIGFVGLRAKLYALKIKHDEKIEESKKCKGVKKSAVKKQLCYDDYYTSLMGEVKEEIQKMSSFNCIRSMTHQVFSLQVNKVGLNSNDDKRYLLNHTDTLSHGHYMTKN